MSGHLPIQLSAPPAHPPELVEADRSYLVRWGRREIGCAFLATALSCLCLVLAAAHHRGGWMWLLAPILPASALSILFFRNPRRHPPAGTGLLLAPADGRVIEVAEVEEPEYIRGPALKVGIFLSIFDVHVNRAPASGRVEYLRHRDGLHLDARNDRSRTENESQAIGLLSSESGIPAATRLLVRQVSGAIARRIVCPLEEGQELERGRLIGMIKYGSRTELFVAALPGSPLPEVQVGVGDPVLGGETVLYRYPAEAVRP
jgi:phosphatidylserine decarboxylase